MTTPTPDQQDLYRQRAWQAYDLAADEHRDGPTWEQAFYRNRCGTSCCYAGLLAIANGRKWLVDYDGTVATIDGTPIGSYGLTADEYLIAAPGDPENAIKEMHERNVIHVRYVAAALIGLDPYGHHADDGGLFAGGNDLGDLARFITEQIGPRPVSVGGTDN